MPAAASRSQPTSADRRAAAPPARVLCRTPTPGAQPTSIEAWKFNCVRMALLSVLPPLEGGGEGLPFRGLAARVAAQLAPADRERLGSPSWYVTTVKLELECRGEVRRSVNSPQRLWRCG